MIDGLGDLVQFWIENPAENFGMAIMPTGESYGYVNLWSSEYSNESLRPKLVLDGQIVPVDGSSWSAVKHLY